MDSVSGNFTLPTALGDDLPLTTIHLTSFSFTDGVQTITNSTSLLPTFQIGTNATGTPNDWNIQIKGINASVVFDIITTSDIKVFDSGDQSNLAGTAENKGVNNNAPGNWSVASTSVAEPDSAWLLAAGLAFLFWRERSAAMALVRRRQRLIEPAAS